MTTKTATTISFIIKSAFSFPLENTQKPPQLHKVVNIGYWVPDLKSMKSNSTILWVLSDSKDDCDGDGGSDGDDDGGGVNGDWLWRLLSGGMEVFDCCLSTSTKSEKEYKSYLGGVVTSLHNCHPGASVMVFNFREGDQISLLSDILIDYDMTVVDYPRHYEGYPLLPLEMIHYFLRSGESWLSLEGQKNVILMHCEKGGWPVLAFMLAGLLLYRKQYSGEQKTLEMVYKQAPKELHSVLSPINPRASQLRYLQYITGRDLASEWPPSEAPVIVDYLLLRNLPLYNGGKGCRPVVRVYGQDPSARANRSAQLLFSSLTADEPALQYSKEECVFVKLELRCQTQGDVFLECIHLHDDKVSEEMIFKVMFHTGFVQSNILALNSDDIDVPWNTKLPKDFKAEVLFRDMNEVPVNITLELGVEEESHDSDSEFFEVEEIFTPTSDSGERKDFSSVIIQEMESLDNRNKDYTLRNGAPRWDLEVAEVDAITPEEATHKQADSEAESDIGSTSSKNIVVVDACGSDVLKVESVTSTEGNYKEGKSEAESDKITTSNKIAVVDSCGIDKLELEKVKTKDKGNYKEANLEAETDVVITSSKNIVVVDSCGSEIQDVKVEFEPKAVVIPSPAKPKQNKKNKWQEMTAKTITQQRVISQWVPRAKTMPATEANKPKAPIYKWVPKAPAKPTETAGEE